MLEKFNNTQKIGWINAKDSLSHALDHFVELHNSKSETWHHQKWIILSVHHAAACLVSIWLREADNNHILFQNESGNEAYPHLNDTIKALQKFKGTEHLTEAESKLLILLKRLNMIRNDFMHRFPPKEINKELVAFAATSMVGLLVTIERRSGIPFHEQFYEDRDIRQHIIEAIHYSKIEEYTLFIEKMLEEKGHLYPLPQCPCCGANTVVNNHCEACFEDLEEMECPGCEEEIIIQSGYPFEQECPECGHKFKA